VNSENWIESLTAIVFDERSLLIAVAVALAGFLRGFIGFGAALVSIPVISLVFGPQLALPIVTIMGIPSVLQLLPDAVRHSELPIVMPISFAVFLGTPIGTLVLVSVDPDLMKIVISLLVILMVGFLTLGWQLNQQVHPSILLLSGFTGGLIQGAAGIGGPPVVAIALSRAGSPDRQRGNVLAVMTAIVLSSVLPLYYYGLITLQVIAIGLVLFPIYSISTWIGSRYFGTGGRHHFRRAALFVLAVIGISTLIAACWQFAGKL
jgi:uncharacterized membrane protein YfcA